MACNTGKVTVKFAVTANVEKLFIVGSTKNLGAWDAAKAVELTYCEKCGKFTVSKQFDADSVVEFKVLAAKDWAAVEKGAFGEEVENHTFTAVKGYVAEADVKNFA